MKIGAKSLMEKAVPFLLKFSQVLIFLSFGSSALHGQVSEIQQELLTVPEITVGASTYRAEFSLLPNSNPVQFRLVTSSKFTRANSTLAATFNNSVLDIPDVLFNGESYWLKLTDSGDNIFTVSGWGLNNHSARTFDHGAEFLRPVWQRLNGSAYDIGVGANGDVWVVGTNDEAGGFGIYKISGSRVSGLRGGAIRVDVDANGNPWIINDDDRIYRWHNGAWQRLPGEALDIGIGADGSVWVASYEGVYKWDGAGWTDFGGAGSRIDVGPDGRPWVVGFSDRIYTLQGDSWRRLPGEASDIGVGANGAVWVVSPAKLASDGFEEPRRIYRWNGIDWDRVDGDAFDISVGPDGMPWVTNSYADIYRGS
ncbi:MAG: tectonin domain-containing protein [Pseudohongiellaceae bacterium]